jgi:hypothetical protein
MADWQGMASSGVDRHGMAGEAGHGPSRQGMDWLSAAGRARQAKDRRGVRRHGRLGSARRRGRGSAGMAWAAGPAVAGRSATRQARQGLLRVDADWHGRQGKESREMASRGMAGEARHGGSGRARRARQGRAAEDWPGMAGEARFVMAGRGLLRQAWQAEATTGRAGTAWRG